ncbi:MAG: nitrophenyl compound nitroreductase subunit ArsF family protein [Dehalococcoidia bacterium]
MGVFTKVRLVAMAAMLLLTIVIVSACKVPSGNTNGQPTVTPSAQDVVEVVYFHRAQRCAGCIHAQDTTEYTLSTYFADELENGDIVFMALNLQDANNSAMVQKFGAYTSSLFLNDVSNSVDDIEELTDVWFVLWDDEEFVDIVKTAIEECLAD